MQDCQRQNQRKQDPATKPLISERIGAPGPPHDCEPVGLHDRERQHQQKRQPSKKAGPHNQGHPALPPSDHATTQRPTLEWQRHSSTGHHSGSKHDQSAGRGMQRDCRTNR